jgi:hypothetical protein
LYSSKHFALKGWGITFDKVKNIPGKGEQYCSPFAAGKFCYDPAESGSPIPVE